MDKMVTIQGKLFFAKSMHEKPMPPWITDESKARYEINIGNIDDATAKRLKAELNVKTKSKDEDKYERGNFITVKSMFPFVIEDEAGNKLDASSIGNGSVATVTLKSREHALSAMHGFSPQAIGGRTKPHVVVKELVVYDPEAEEDIPL